MRLTDPFLLEVLDGLEDVEDLLEDEDDDEDDDVLELVLEDEDLGEDDEGEWSEWADPFPVVRSVLAPELQHLPPQDIERLLAGMGLDAEDMEFDLGKALTSIGKAAAGLAPTVLPVAGGVLGTALGGPLGGMVGSQLGGLAGGAVAGAARPPTRRPRRRTSARRPAAGRARPRPAAGSAVGSLLGVLGRPELRQAVSALALGPAGARTIPVAGTAVPPAAFVNLLTSLGSRVLGEQAGGHEDEVSEYLLDEVGNLAVDPTVPEQRGERLLALLEDAAEQESAWIEDLAMAAWRAGADRDAHGWSEVDDD